MPPLRKRSTRAQEDLGARDLSDRFVRFRDRGDAAALAEVFDALAPRLFAIAAHLAPSRAEAEDVVQTTFLVAIERRAAFDDELAVEPWLAGILWREAAKCRRRAARAVDPVCSGAAEEAREDPVADAMRADAVECVREALSRLPEPTRAALAPYLEGDERPESIARRLGRSAGTVRSQISRGLDRLRESLPASVAPGWAAFALPVGSALELSGVRAEVLARAGGALASASKVPAPLAVSPSSLAGSSLPPRLATTKVLSSAAVLAMNQALVLSLTAAVSVSIGFVVGRLSTPSSDESAASPALAPESERDAGRAAVLDTLPASPAVHGPIAADTRRATSATGGELVPAAPARDAAWWLARFNEAPNDWRHGWRVAQEIAQLEPKEGLAIMREVWPQLSTAVQEQALKPFVLNGGHPEAVGVLRLATGDDDASVRGRALSYLQAYAFEDFSRDPAAGDAWFEQWGDRPLDEVVQGNAERLVARLLVLDTDSLVRELIALDGLDLRAGERAGVDMRAVLQGAGGPRVLDAAMACGDPRAQQRAFEWSPVLGAGEAWLRTHALPCLSTTESASFEIAHAAVRALGRPECTWARPDLFQTLENEATRHLDFSVAQALSDQGDPAAIPELIDLLERRNDERGRYTIGYYGLRKLTGVNWDETMDAAWWREWWTANRHRFEGH